jgi:large subunit ribosomal protein L25
MANTLSLTASRRAATGHKVGALRRAGKLPAVLYGPGLETTPIELDSREASRLLTRVRGMRLIDLTVDGAPHKTLVREIQRDFVRGDLLHVDFYEVAMDRPIRVTVPIALVGEAPGAVEGVVVTGLNELDIECLPGDMVSTVEADLAALKAVGDAIHVRDLYVPSTIKVLTDGDELVARLTYQIVEEEAPAEAPAATAEVEVIERRRKEEEGEEAEGEAES